MPFEEPKRALSYSPVRSPASARMYGTPAQRQPRAGAAAVRKPPEPLRRAVADCLSPAAPNFHGGPSALAPDSARILRDYIANPSTTDMAYNVLIDHALAERDRSPAVVPRCVELLKRHLLRCVPRVQTLRQIDLFCVNSIVECESINHRRMSLPSKSLSQHSRTSSVVSTAFPPSMAASNFVSASLAKSLNYVRSLVARHIPKLSFQNLGLSGPSGSPQQSLPTLSSYLSRSLTSQLNPEVVNIESPERKEAPVSSALDASRVDTNDVDDASRYILFDLLNWRWHGDREYHSSSSRRESDGLSRPQDVCTHSFLEVGAAALLIGDMEAIMDQPSRISVTQDLSDIDQLLQPSTATASTNIASAHGHLKAITAFKRMKPDPHQVWVNLPASTFHPRARRLFQYRHYSEQQPLRLSHAEICEVIAEVCSESSQSSLNLPSVPSPLIKNSECPATDVAVSVLIKLVIDMYVMDSGTAAPLTLSLLEDMLNSQRVVSRTRAFDLILNLGIHAHLLEPILPEDPPMLEDDEASQGSDLNNAEQPALPGKINTETSTHQQRVISAIDNFESWLLVILFEILLFLVQTEEGEELVWASALSCLFFFVCDRGRILRNRLEGLDIRVIKTLLEISRKHSWAEIVHSKLICMLTNMFYQTNTGPAKATLDVPAFYVEQVDLVGGIDFICLEYSRANLREEKRNLFLVLCDYVLHQINEACLSTEVSAFSYEEIQPVVSMLTLADAPEAFYIAVKHGVEGIGEILRRSVSTVLSRSPNYERLDMLLDKVTRKLEATITTCTRLDDEFLTMIQLTKSCKSFGGSEDDASGETDIGMRARLSWATLHSLLHSERYAYRHNGYIWLVDLLLSEISESNNRSIWWNIKRLQEQLEIVGSQDLTSATVPLPISIMCGLLKSKHNFVRWGFLFVLEKLLMRCKLLLDEKELQNLSNGDITDNDNTENRLEKANAVIDIMSCALSLVVQINETDHINILKLVDQMCDILFSQLCLRLHSMNAMSHGDGFQGIIEEANMSQDLQKKNSCKDDMLRNNCSTPSNDTLMRDTASLAALLLRGHAKVPMQLVAHVPASLLFWPLIQLAGAVTDDIALGVAVGSKGRGNLPGAAPDIRAALLLLLMGKCTADTAAFREVEGEEFFRGLLDDTDSRVAYYSSAFLLKRMMTEAPENYQRMLQSLIIKAQQCDNEKVLENPYLQMRGILQLSNDTGGQL